MHCLLAANITAEKPESILTLDPLYETFFLLSKSSRNLLYSQWNELMVSVGDLVCHFQVQIHVLQVWKFFWNYFFEISSL